MPRIHCPEGLQIGQVLSLSPEGARHVQVLRLQPGDGLILFGNPAVEGEYDATVLQMGRRDVEVRVDAYRAVAREAERAVHLAVGMPANERMDWLVEKATELGVASIQPLVTERTVLRLKGERAEKKQAHWQAIAIAACEQCGRNRVPDVYPVRTLQEWLAHQPSREGLWRGVLSLATDTRPLSEAVPPEAEAVCFVSGPEGGLSPAEDELLRRQGFTPVGLGPRVLRAETAALAALARLTG